MSDLQGKRALVTGASSGIGRAFAELLAARGCDTILTARRRDRLEALAAELRERFGTRAEVIEADLSAPGAASALWDQARAGGPVDILINNAGFGDHCFAARRGAADAARMVQLNVAALTELSVRAARDMLSSERRSYILNVASVVGFFPVAYFATYSGTKAFVLNFSESLAAELKNTNVSVTCLSPGPVETEFGAVADVETPSFARGTVISAERCARAGIEAMLRGRRQCVPGFLNRLTLFLHRFLPRRAVGAMMAASLETPPRQLEASS